MNRIVKGDKVKVIAGDDRGTIGTVLRVLPKENRVVISKVNIITRHKGRQQAGRAQVQMGRIQYEAPIHLSNVMLLCEKCGEATRVGFEVGADGSKARVCRKCGQVID